MNGTAAIQIHFWGVRGSIPTPGPETIRYGGNTACVEVRTAGKLIILDAGTGLRGLGARIARADLPVDADIFFSHMHWDHIQGFPFFAPAFGVENRFRLHAARKEGDGRLRTVLERQMHDPNFPVPISVMRSGLQFMELEPGDTIELGDGVRVRTAPLVHPGGCIGLRVEHNDKAVIYATDHEHRPDGVLHEPLLELARGADLMIYDSMYTEAEYETKRGWGHSTFRAGLILARAANVRQLYFFHHEPTHDDAFLDGALADARALVAGDPRLVVEMAKEHETVYL